MRVYVPLTLSGLAEAYKTGQLEAEPFVAYAVTPALREWYLSDDTEELEYAALLAAARASLRLLDVDPVAARRRAVIAADVPDDAASPMDDPHVEPGAVRIEADVRLSDVASAHLDGAAAEEDVRAAVGVVLEADLGSEDSQFLVDQAEGHELSWYATQEIGPMLDLL